jgi:hypothetical protein
MYAKLPSNIHRKAFLAVDRGMNRLNSLLREHGKFSIKSLKHKIAGTLYTFGCNQTAA